MIQHQPINQQTTSKSISSRSKQPISTINMAQIPPGDIATQPGQKVIFNAPFDDKHTYYMKVS
jgi:hypothetical protein